jgi:hypothetical protein
VEELLVLHLKITLIFGIFILIIKVDEKLCSCRHRMTFICETFSCIAKITDSRENPFICQTETHSLIQPKSFLHETFPNISTLGMRKFRSRQNYLWIVIYINLPSFSQHSSLTAFKSFTLQSSNHRHAFYFRHYRSRRRRVCRANSR